MAAAAASGATSSTVTVYHYSKRPIEKWGTFSEGNFKSRQTIGRRGKPIGLWYAYETAWINALGGNHTKYYKYAFPIRQDQIVGIDEKPDIKKILRLSTIEDLTYFFELTGPGNYKKMVNNSYEAATQGGENVYEEDDYDDNVGVGEGEGEGEGVYVIDWPAYWASISKAHAGIEFTGELIRPRSTVWMSENILVDLATGDEIDISWLRTLDIPSGVIFHPEEFFGEVPPETFLQTAAANHAHSTLSSRKHTSASRKHTSASRKHTSARRKQLTARRKYTVGRKFFTARRKR